ncbi:MAG: glycine-rich protein, partial [Patescibacteria group bacterium]
MMKKILLILALAFLFPISAFAGSQTFNATGANQTFIVPEGVTSLSLALWGASGGDVQEVGAHGGPGGYTTGALSVVGGQHLSIIVGKKGNSLLPGRPLSYGGYPDGGNGWICGGGGGRSAVYFDSTELMDAGAGGGACSSFLPLNGGYGGGITGGVGIAGGTQTSGGQGEANGAHLLGARYREGTTGASGGGGGWYGGSSNNHSGGGGGSGHCGGPRVSGCTTAQSSGSISGTGEGVIRITWTTPPPVNHAIPTALPIPRTYTVAQTVRLSALNSSYINYTINGTVPTCAVGTVYTTPISVATTKTIKAIACYPTGSSAVATFAYIINLPDTTLPTVFITAPANASTVSGTAVSINANATDNIRVVGVQFKLDGVNLGAEDLVAPYTTNWNTITATNGAHQLTAIARDVAGNRKTSTVINVTVNNALATLHASPLP